MVKLLVLHNKILPYREKIFELLDKHYDLTVAFSDPQSLNKNYNFKTIYTPGKWKGPFFIHDKSLNALCSQYEAVLTSLEVRSISIMGLSLVSRRKYSLTRWGIGVSASYASRYDENKRWDFLRYFFAKRADSIVFYSHYPVEKYVNAGFKRDKLFVANNTTPVSPNLNPEAKKESFLFVGTLYKEKGINILLEAYGALKDISEHDLPLLNIIGEGPERQFIEQWIKEHGMENKVFLHGAIFDDEILRTFYEKSIACVSPNQAGLSVLSSMGYATVFVTEKTAITGGEIFNITNMVNGILYEGGAAELTGKLKWIVDNKQKVIEMGKMAKEHYDQECTPEGLVNSLIEAVSYALKEKNK